MRLGLLVVASYEDPWQTDGSLGWRVTLQVGSRTPRSQYIAAYISANGLVAADQSDFLLVKEGSTTSMLPGSHGPLQRRYTGERTNERSSTVRPLHILTSPVEMA